MSLTGKVVVLIDDDPDLRNLVRKVLEGVGMVIHEAGSIKDGMPLIRGMQPHLIVLDLSMPEEDGFSFLQKRTTDLILQGIPVLVLSGHSDADSVKKAISLGANSYLIKPFQSNLLIQRVRRICHEFSDGISFTLPIPAEVRAIIPAKLTRLSSRQAMLESPVRFSLSRPLEVLSEFLKSLKLKSSILKVNGLSVSQPKGGLYQTPVQFIGLDEENEKKIDKETSEWL